MLMTTFKALSLIANFSGVLIVMLTLMVAVVILNKKIDPPLSPRSSREWSMFFNLPSQPLTLSSSNYTSDRKRSPRLWSFLIH